MDAKVLVDRHDQLNDTCKLFLDLIRTAENMRVVQRHRAHPMQAGQCTGHFIAVPHAKLSNTDRQIPVAVHIALINHHMVRTVHRTKNKLFVVHLHFREHIFLIVLPVTGGFVQLHVSEHRRVHVLVPEPLFHVHDITLQGTAQFRAVWRTRSAGLVLQAERT